jgi:hypothetical protein
VAKYKDKAKNGRSYEGGPAFKALPADEFQFRSYKSVFDETGELCKLKRAWCEQNLELVHFSGDETEAELAFVSKVLGQEPPKSKKREKKPITAKRTRSELGDQIDQIKGARTLSSSNSRRSKKKCVVSRSTVKREPAEPSEGTKLQIKYLIAFAQKLDQCTCHYQPKQTFDQHEEQVAFTSLETAKQCVTAALREVRANAGSELPQSCSAFSILEKNKKFLVLKTSSAHTVRKPAIETTQETKKVKTETSSNVLFRMLRPSKEPELTAPFNEESGRYYAIRSCPACKTLPSDDPQGVKHVLMSSVKDFPSDERIEETFGKKMLSGARTAIHNAASPYDYACRLRRIRDIQSNETKGKPFQDGWSLHHAEMEALFYSRRRGWTIREMHIDRDCCGTCGATLNSFATEVFRVITIIDWSKYE